MIDKWYGEIYHEGKGLNLNKLCRIKGGLVKILKQVDQGFEVKDYKTGTEFFFDDYILQVMYKEIEEAKVILYGL